MAAASSFNGGGQFSALSNSATDLMIFASTDGAVSDVDSKKCIVFGSTAAFSAPTSRVILMEDFDFWFVLSANGWVWCFSDVSLWSFGWIINVSSMTDAAVGSVSLLALSFFFLFRSKHVGALISSLWTRFLFCELQDLFASSDVVGSFSPLVCASSKIDLFLLKLARIWKQSRSND